MSPLFQQLTRLFRKFPGIGSRQAERFVYFILQQDESYVRELQDLLMRIRKSMRLCTESFQFFYDEDPSQTLSPIVRNPERTKEMLMIVLKDMDAEAIERNNIYRGQYFILGGLVPLIEKDVENHIRLRELLALVEKRAEKDGLREIILAFPVNTEGGNTERYIKQKLEPLSQKYNLIISILGRGLSTGTELEYIDHDTFASALETRK